MSDLKLAVIESRFADIIWEKEPIPSGVLVKICEKELNWKKPTTYTVLRKLCQRGIFKNDTKFVTSIISREEFYAMQSEKFVEDNFEGSLPAFIAAFTGRKKLTRAEAKEIRKLIEGFEEE